MAETVGIILLMVLLFLFGLWHLLYILDATTKNAGSKKWPVTTARVVEKGISEYLVNDEPTTYLPKVTYQYRVKRKKYELTTDQFKPVVYNRRWEAEEALKALPATIEVRYNPRRPQIHITAFYQERKVLTNFVYLLTAWLVFLILLPYAIKVG